MVNPLKRRDNEKEHRRCLSRTAAAARRAAAPVAVAARPRREPPACRSHTGTRHASRTHTLHYFQTAHPATDRASVSPPRPMEYALTRHTHIQVSFTYVYDRLPQCRRVVSPAKQAHSHPITTRPLNRNKILRHTPALSSLAPAQQPRARSAASRQLSSLAPAQASLDSPATQ